MEVVLLLWGECLVGASGLWRVVPRRQRLDASAPDLAEERLRGLDAGADYAESSAVGSALQVLLHRTYGRSVFLVGALGHRENRRVTDVAVEDLEDLHAANAQSEPLNGVRRAEQEGVALDVRPFVVPLQVQAGCELPAVRSVRRLTAQAQNIREVVVVCEVESNPHPHALLVLVAMRQWTANRKLIVTSR